MSSSFNDALRDDVKREEERQRLLQEQQIQQQQAEQQQQVQEAQEAAEAVRGTPERYEQIAENAQTSQKQQRERGWVTKTGEALEGILTEPVNSTAAVINALTPDDAPWKSFTQALDDNIITNEEAAERLEAKLAADGRKPNAFLKGVRDISTGVETGIEGGLAIPFTIAGRVTNQATPWADPPELIKDSVLGETAFEVAQILTPTLILGAAAPGALGTKGVAAYATGMSAESLLETATQDSMEDAIAGRTLAESYGRIAEYYGFDGAQLTTDLIEGKKPHAQAINTVTLFFQNLGINIGADQLMSAAFKRLGRKAVSETAESVAEVTGKNVEEVQLSLLDTNPAAFNPLKEPSEVQNIDTIVPVAKPSSGKKFVNDDAALAQLIKDGKLDAESFNSADRSYFANLRAVNRDRGMGALLQEVSDSISPYVKDGSKQELRRVARQGLAWVKRFRDDATGVIDLDAALANLRGSRMVKDLDAADAQPFLKKALGNRNIDDVLDEEYLREFGMMTPQGAAAMKLVNEEIGIRSSRAATAALNLDRVGADFTAAADTFVDMVRKSEQFLVPHRRYKRRASVGLAVENTDALKKSVEGTTTEASKSTAKGVSYSPSSYLTEVGNTGLTIDELWKRAKGGDANALKTFKQFMTLVAYGNPENAVKQIGDLDDVLKQQLKKGNTDATRQLFYSYQLTRLRPQTNSISSNILGLLKDPLGAILSGERAYGMGQYVGGLTVWNDAFQQAARTFRDGTSITSSSKLDMDIVSRTAKDTQIEREWLAQKTLMKKDNVNGLVEATAFANYLRRKFSNSRVNTVATRALNAGDAWANTLFAGQVVGGRAWRRAAAEGVSKDSFKMKRIFHEEWEKVFGRGKEIGKIEDPDVLAGARYLTFQKDIPKNGNFVDNAFLGLEKATKSSAWWAMFSPYTRMTYNTMEQAGRVVAGSLGPPGEWLLRRIPRYDAIMRGDYGDVAQLQLKSNLAFGQYFGLMNLGLGAAGMATGHNPPPGMPKTSYIIPAPNEKGYVALDYSMFEPVASIASIQIDLAQAVRDELISEKDFGKFMTEMMYAVGAATLDKSFNDSMANMARFMDISNINEGTAVGSANVVSQLVVGQTVGGVGGLTRMGADWLQPNQTINTTEADLNANFWLQFRKRVFGGLGNPTKYSPYTGEPETKRVQFGSDVASNIFGGFTNEAMPGNWRTSINSNRTPLRNIEGLDDWSKFRGDKVEFVFAHLDRMGIDKDIKRQLKHYKGIPLSAEEQSTLSKAFHDHGNLNERLWKYFKGADYQRSYQKLVELRNKYGVDSSIVAKQKAKIDKDINAIYRQAKEIAARQALLRMESFTTKYNEANNLSLDNYKEQYGEEYGNYIADILNLPVK